MDDLEQVVRYSELLSLYQNLLSPTQKEILEDYYLVNLSFSEIAENANLSDQYSAHLNQASLIKLLCVIGRNSNHTNKHSK